MPALGDEFRSAREARGLTLSDVAEQIHIRSVYLNAIENEDWPSIGAPVYVRGFIRTYARFLALDGEQAVQQFNETIPPERPPVPAVTVATIPERERSAPSVWALAAGLAAVILVAFVAYEWWQFSQGPATPVTQATPVPRVAPTLAPSPAPTAVAPVAAALPSPLPTAAASSSAHHQLAVVVSQRSWLRVVVDGAPVMEGIFPAGTTRTFTGATADVRAGNAGGVAIAVDGAPAKTLGGTGDVVERQYTL